MKLRKLDLDESPQTAEHQALGIPPLETRITHAVHPWRRDALLLLLLPTLALAIYAAEVWWLPAGWQPVVDEVLGALH